MADPRRTFSNVLRVEAPGRSPFTVRHEGLIAQDRRLTVRVPAGKTVLAKLDELTVVAVTDPTFVALESDVPGVEFWTIDNATPSVEEDTERFGPIIDYGWPEFVHDHGFAIPRDPGKTIDHTGTLGGATIVGTRLFYDELPTLVSYKNHRLDPLSNPEAATGTVYAQRKAAYRVGQMVDGELTAFNMSHAFPGGAADEGTGRSMGWLYGHERRADHATILGGGAGYRNFGTDYDDISFFPVFWVRDANALSEVLNRRFRLQFFSYPYSAITYPHPDFLPAETYVAVPAAVPIWSPTDLMLDFDVNYQPADTWLETGGHFAYYNYMRHPPLPDPARVPAHVVVDGHQIWQMAYKHVWEHNPTLESATGVDGEDPVWNRITAGFFTTYCKGSETVEAQLVQIYFGPQPGRSGVLNEIAYVTDKAWSVGSIPAIGLQNPTSRDALVRIRYGAART